jgi:predicted dehydrogenase
MSRRGATRTRAEKLDGGRPVRWGIFGHGGIVPKFLDAADVVDGHETVAVCGRDRSRANAFSRRYGIDRAFTDLRAMISESEIDALYVATPHSSHHDATVAALESGVAVLCEKPMAVNAAQARRMIDAAKASNRFLMEAMWTRFLPIHETVRKWISAGRIGEIKLIEAAFGFAADFDAEHRLFDPDLAGGALLDVGVYPLTFARWLYGEEPRAVAVQASFAPSGVDDNVEMQLTFPSGGVAQLGCALRVVLPNVARVIGTEGHIEIPQFWRAREATLHCGGGVERASAPHVVNGFEYQIAEVGRCLAAGRVQSETVPWSESIAMAELCDRIRADMGLRYPADET